MLFSGLAIGLFMISFFFYLAFLVSQNIESEAIATKEPLKNEADAMEAEANGIDDEADEMDDEADGMDDDEGDGIDEEADEPD